MTRRPARPARVGMVRGWILSHLRPGTDASPAAVVDRIAREVEQLRRQLAG